MMDDFIFQWVSYSKVLISFFIVCIFENKIEKLKHQIE